MYQTTTENGKYTFTNDNGTIKIYRYSELQEEGSKAILSLLQKLERYEKALKRIVKQTSCDDTWDFANRVLEGKLNNDLFYRMNID